MINNLVLTECKVLKHVVSSSAEAETVKVFHNTQITIPIRHILKKLNHPQPAIPIKMKNSTVIDFVHKNMHYKRSKSWDIYYY